MNVLHYRQTFSKISETFIYDYLTELERQGIENHVATHERKNSESRPFRNVYDIGRTGRWYPERVFYRLLVPFGIGTRQTSKWPDMRRRLRALVRKVAPDVIHAHFGREGVVAAPIAESLGIPLVVTFYGFDISSLPKKDFWVDAYDRLWGQVDAVTVLSEKMRGEAKKLGCPTEKLNIVRLSRRLDQLPFRLPSRRVRKVLFVGRLTPKKAPLDAIQAIEHANTKGANLKLDILGDGPLKKKVDSYVRGKGISDFVNIHGYVENEEVISSMVDSDAFLLPSKTAPNGDQEGTPTVLVEAQAIGLPCVSTRHSGIPEMIPKENHHLLSEEGDVEVMGNVLNKLYSKDVSDIENIAKRGRRMVVDNFDIVKSVGKLKDIYSYIV